MNPLGLGRKHDEKDRCSINERLWDMRLESFSYLFIDNYTSGRRRDDIKMMRPFLFDAMISNALGTRIRKRRRTIRPEYSGGCLILEPA